MNRFLTFLLLVVSTFVASAANPTLENFDQTHFRTNNPPPGIIRTRLSSSNFDQSGDTWSITNITGATGATLWTNDLSISGDDSYGYLRPITGLDYRYIAPSNYYGLGWFGLSPKFQFLQVGTTELDSTVYSSFYLLSAETNAAIVQVRLAAGNFDGHELWLLSMTNTPWDGRFTLPANSAVSGAGSVKLNNDQDWLGANGSSMKLIWLNPDWWEVGRWTAGSTNQPQSLIINPTDGRVPYRVNANTFGDSPWLRVDSDTVGLNSTTNTFSQDGINVIYEGSAVVGNPVNIGVKRGATTVFFGQTTAGGALVQSPSNRAILDVGNVQVFWDGTNFAPADASKNLGTAINPWLTLYLTPGGGSGTFVRAGSGTPEGAVSANVSSLFMRTDGGSGTTLYTKTSGTGNTGWEVVAAGGGAGIAGTVINTGASTVGAVPRYTDTTGTNVAPSTVTISPNGTVAITNAAITDQLLELNAKADTTNNWFRLKNGTSIDIALGRYPWTDATVNDSAVLTLETADNGGNSFWRARRARGTITSKTAVQANDTLTSLSAVGYDGVGYNHHSDTDIELTALNNFNSNSHPTAILFKGTITGQTLKSEWARFAERSLLIGATNATLGILETYGNRGSAQANSVYYGGYANNAAIFFKRANGTIASPTVSVQGDVLGAISAVGYDTQAWATTIAAGAPVAILFFADQTFTSGAHGSYMTFGTTPNGSTTRAERIRITTDGNVGISTTTPTSTLHVAGSVGHSIATGTAFTLTATNEVYLVNVDAQTVTLPTAVGVNGRTYTVKAIAPCTTATVATTSSQLIDGATTYSLSASNKFVRVISDNARWWIIGQN